MTSPKRGPGQPPVFKSVEELQEKVDAYFSEDGGQAWMTTDDKKVFAPTMAGLALACGVDRKTITNYANKDEFFPTIKKARSIIEAHLERRLYGGNVTGVIFNLKNNFDWKDKTEVEQTNVELTHDEWIKSLE